jgi:hypothetical protein
LGALALAALVGAIVVTLLNASGIWTSGAAGPVPFILIIAAMLLALAALAGRWAGVLRTPQPAAQQQELALALMIGLVAIMLLYVAASFGYVWLIYPVMLVATVALLVRVVAGRRARRSALLAEPAAATVAAPAGTGRMRLARLFSALALICLACGSSLLAAAMIWTSVAEGDSGEKGLAFALLFVTIWPPTFVLTWAFGAAAFWAKGTLDPPAAVLAFLVGFMAFPLLLPLLPLLAIGAVYLAWRWFWRESPQPATLRGDNTGSQHMGASP